jgi:hypothetical protein
MDATVTNEVLLHLLGVGYMSWYSNFMQLEVIHRISNTAQAQGNLIMQVINLF